MATVTFSALGAIGDSFENYARDTVVIAGPTTYIWTSPDGHRVILVGTFSYPGGIGTDPTGTVDQIEIDHGNNGSIDMTVKYGASPINMGDLLGTSFATFLNEVFGQADTMTLAGTVISGADNRGFSFDGHSGLVTTSDVVTISGQGNFLGDRLFPTTVGTPAAADTVTITSLTGDVRVSGDWGYTTSSSSSGSTYAAAGDAITIDPVAMADIEIFGDVFDILSLNLAVFEGGGDTITGGAVSFTAYGETDDTGNALTTALTLNGGDDSITGSSSADKLYGDVFRLGTNVAFTGGDDTLDGGGGADLLVGDYEVLIAPAIAAGGADFILGGGGDDTLIGGLGNDTLSGNANFDTADYSYSTLGMTITLGLVGTATNALETDTLSSIERIIGSDMNDVITGSSANETFEGRGGDDSYFGGGGIDTVVFSGHTSGVNVDLRITATQSIAAGIAETFQDIENLVGTDFNDRLTGSNSNNVLTGGYGNDTLMAIGGSANTLDGGDGDDEIHYESQNPLENSYHGGNGTDTFVVGGVNFNTNVSFDLGLGEMLIGGSSLYAVVEDFENYDGSTSLSGDEQVTGSDGANSIQMGGGNNTVVGTAGNDTLDGGGQDGAGDTLDYSNSLTGVSLNLDTGLSLGAFAATDVISNFEHVIGTNEADTLIGNGSDNDLTGADGGDSLSGENGNDTLSGGEGNDTLQGGAGADELAGGAGVDVATYSSAAARVEVDLSAGTGAAGDAAGDVLSDIEWLIGSDFNDRLIGGGAADIIDGAAGNDNLNGLGGDDLLVGGAGNDQISGGNGGDSMVGGLNNDLLFGNGDDDTIQGDSGNDTVFGGTGNDEVFGGTGADEMLGQGGADTLLGDSGDDILRGGSGNDSLLGGDNNDTLYGNGNNDTLNGGAGDDVLQGAAGADVLLGGSGDDTLTGSVGADRLDGGSGNDTLNGGGADGVRDIYVFMVGYDQDRINAFDQAGTDRLELDESLWSGTNPGLTAQQVIDTFGSMNVAGNILTLDFGGGDILEVQNAAGITQATLGADVVFI